MVCNVVIVHSDKVKYFFEITFSNEMFGFRSHEDLNHVGKMVQVTDAPVYNLFFKFDLKLFIYSFISIVGHFAITL